MDGWARHTFMNNNNRICVSEQACVLLVLLAHLELVNRRPQSHLDDADDVSSRQQPGQRLTRTLVLYAAILSATLPRAVKLEKERTAEIDGSSQVDALISLLHRHSAICERIRRENNSELKTEKAALL